MRKSKGICHDSLLIPGGLKIFSPYQELKMDFTVIIK